MTKKKKKDEETYNLTVLGLLVSEGNISREEAINILNGAELYGRRTGFNNPAILLRGVDSAIVDIEPFEEDKK